MLVTICGSLERGYESSMEHLTWRQLKGAYGVKLVLAPLHYPSLDEMIPNLKGKKIFFIAPGRTESEDFKDYVFPEGDINLIFGTATENLVRFVTEDDDVVSIHTPHTSVLMSTSVIGIILNKLYERR
jgi:hypothetical protein